MFRPGVTLDKKGITMATDETRRVSADEPDWSREEVRRLWDPSRQLLRSIRRYQYWRDRGGFFSLLALKYYVLTHRFWSVVTGAEIQLNSTIEGGLLLLHPNGIVIHPKASIGPNCLIFQQVTIGGTESGDGLPKIGGHVDIGAGARILGPVSVGDHAVIGANAVVVSDVPPSTTVVGIPAAPLSK